MSGQNGLSKTSERRIQRKKMGESSQLDLEYRKEEMLRDEVRTMRNITITTAQWGVTVLVLLYTAIIFLRQHTRDQLVAGKLIQPGEPLPVHRYVLGTFLLLITAAVISVFMFRSGRLLRHYVKQLENCASGIKDATITNHARLSAIVLFFSFPAFDVIVNFYLHITWGIKL